MTAFGVPLADMGPYLQTVPLAYAQSDPPYPGISNSPSLAPCAGALGTGVLCTDYGQYVAGLAKVKNRIDYQLTFAAYMSLMNAATLFAQTIAYDTAEWAANGFRGQSPGIFTDPFGEYTQKLFLDSVGEFMGTFSQNFTEGLLGFNLCRPPNFPNLALEFALGLPDLTLSGIQRPRPKCSWTDITQNWEQSSQSLDNVESIRNIKANFSTGGNDIAFGLGAHLAFFDFVAEKRQAGIQERILGNGYKDVKSFISGKVETPAETVQRSIENQIIENPAMAQNFNQGALFNNAFNLGWVQLGVVTASTFTNVLLSRLLQKVSNGLVKLFAESSPLGLPNLLDPNAVGPGATSPREIFASQYSDLKTPRINRADAQDLLAELTGCPVDARTKWNCALDQAFATALRQGGGMTLQQAVEQQFIKADWQFIPSTRLQDNQDTSCYLRAFCVANLRKLRLSRIIPVGWELAADSPQNQQACAQGDCVTLGEVMRSYDDCNASGGLDAQHPYCHLVDPNWVLTVMPAQCLTQGFGNQMLAGTTERLSECQDTVTCLERDKDGNCVGGYGFCMAEQTFWQFDAPSCQEQYASCRSFTPRGTNARPVSYLRSTLDYGTCNESNVGCMWYATQRSTDRALDPDTAWNATTTPADSTAYVGAGDRIYLDKNAPPCDASQDGCTALRRITSGRSSLNFAYNGSFESVTGTTSLPEGWSGFASNGQAPSPAPTDGAGSVDGGRAILASQASWGSTGFGNLTTPLFSVTPYRQYVLSFYARRFTGDPQSSYVAVKMYQQDGSAIPAASNFYTGTECTFTDADERGVAIPANLGETWTRFTCSFVVPPTALFADVRVNPAPDDASAPLVDAVQLEEGEIPTPFVDGLSPTLAAVNLKVAPDELACTGDDATDHPLCANYARVCRQTEAGCQGWRPKNQSGAPEVPAVVGAADSCPAECVGYAEFRKQPSAFDLVANTDPRLDDPNDDTQAFFIPSTGLSCSAKDVGCERFTNLDAATLGGEVEAAFSYLRSCEAPGADSQTFYTWEGSDTSGYQLKTWSLKLDTAASFPQGPKVIEKAGPDGVLKDAASCDAASYVRATDPDCRQFYDPQGNAFYRFESQTVLSSADCRQYRKDGSSLDDCEKTGGAFDAQSGQCLYRAVAAQSLTCEPAVAGCRAYVGTQGRAREEVFFEEFTSTSTLSTPTGSGTFAISNESVLVGDTSLRVTRNGNANGLYLDLGPLEGGALYELTFWAKSSGPAAQLDIDFLNGMSNNRALIINAGTTALSPEWRTYRVGPIRTQQTADTNTFVFRVTQSDITFFDKVRLTRVDDIAYVVKDSWNTPASCDRTPEGIPAPQAMLGCETWTSRTGTEATVRQFSRLCREAAIGCSAYVNTQNSVSPLNEMWEKLGSSGSPNERTYVLNDRVDYYIEDPSKVCRADAVSCRAFGKPNYLADRLALDGERPFTTVYLKADPATYEASLCSEPELFCESYTYTTGDGASGTAYFRAPGGHACEYRSGVVIPDGSIPGMVTSGQTYDGWFIIGQNAPCYGDRLMNGNVFGLRLTGDLGFNAWAGSNPSVYPSGQTYEGWSATCPGTQSECTEFRDVNDTSDPLRPAGRPYFVVADNRLDRTSCNGQVDPGRGCVLFRDASDARMLYNIAATYEAYKNNNYQSVAPVDCVAQASNPFCAAAGATANDTNVVVKVQPDRSCSEWLSCSTAETVYDPQDGQYKSLCSTLALCNKAGNVEGAGVPFCANYLDRGQSSTQTLLIQDRVLDAGTYASRSTGFGAKDYSGATVPDQFQVMDTELIPVGANLNPDLRTKGQFKKDYRLAVGVPRSLVDPPTAIELSSLAGSPQAFLPFVCVLTQTGAFGLFSDASGMLDPNANGALDSGEDALCWVSVNQALPPDLGVAGAPIVADNLNAIALLTRLTQSAEPALDPVLSRSFPDTQCKAAPEADAPFGNEFVLEWDGSVVPPRPRRVAAGYSQVNFCEYGEACACTYKRVEYGGHTKFYEPLSTDVVNAVCSGGPRDGQPCVVDAGIAGSSISGTGVDDGGDSDATNDVKIDLSQLSREGGGRLSDPNSICGEGGTCTPIKAVKLVRGGQGQCLEYDLARTIAGDSSRNECLLWSPNPVFSGPGDPYHWIPTAGFQPPQSSGRYYCTAPFRQPKTVAFKGVVTVYDEDGNLKGLGQNVGFTKNTSGKYAGNIDRFTYSDAIASDKSCFTGAATAGTIIGAGLGGAPGAFVGNQIGEALDTCDGNEGGGSLDGALAEGTDMGRWCEEADDDQDPAFDGSAVRLVTTGKGQNRGYAEYAVMLDWQQIGKAIAGYPANASFARMSAADQTVVEDNSVEDTIAAFEFSTMTRKLGCSYSEDWVQGVGNVDYDEPSSWQNQDNIWLSGFRAELNRNGGKLDRRTARIVTEDGSLSGIPVKVACRNQAYDQSANFSSASPGCYIKVWQLDYRAEGQTKFQAFSPDIARPGMDSLSKIPVYGPCNSDHSWFSIRAVFENTNPGENAQDPESTDPESLNGPFQIVGFWVTACSPAAGPRYIYMKVSMSTADVCRELAETISKDSHDVTAYTDRNWAQGGFAVPRAGYTWSTTNVPFGASLATRDAGEDPLYMTGVRQAQSNVLRPPAFTFPGQTYFRPEPYPTSNWGLLSNVFARIYRIYGYGIREVTRNDWACTDPQSPAFGQWCPNLDTVYSQTDVNGLSGRASQNAQAASAQYCGFAAKCVKTGFAAESVFGQKACNTFSGVNRGLDCSADPDICHRGPVQLDPDGVLRTQFTSCNVQADNNATWVKLGSGAWRCDGSACRTNAVGTSSGGLCAQCNLNNGSDTGCARYVAAQCGAFRCADDSARARSNFGSDNFSSGTWSLCSRPSETTPTSSECPLYVAETCDIPTGATIGVCANHRWAECSDDLHCRFEARNYWPSGPVNRFFASARPASAPMGVGNYTIGNGQASLTDLFQKEHMYFYSAYETAESQYFANDSQALRQAFSPAFSTAAGGWSDPKFFGTPLNSNPPGALDFDRATTVGWNDVSMLPLSPGFVPMVYRKSPQNNSGGTDGDTATCSPNLTSSRTVPSGSGTIPLCPTPTWISDDNQRTSYVLDALERNGGDYPNNITTVEFLHRFGYSSNALQWVAADPNTPPYGYFDRGTGNLNEMVAHYAACEPVSLMYRQSSTAGQPNSARSLGACLGGLRSGQSCFQDTDCIPSGVTQTQMDASRNWCRPVTSGAPSYGITPASGNDPGNQACWPGNQNGACPSGSSCDPANPRHPFREQNSAYDSNICTHPAGYWPKPSLCSDPNDEYCGLFGYDITQPNRDESVAGDHPLPTDVTAGFATPAFLSSQAPGNALDYNYVRYYNPVPPLVAAPDMRTCQGGTCRPSAIGSIGIDGFSEGIINGGAGSHVATLRFYAWAAHEQMPLRRIIIDWGDGTVTELPDAHLKNHKPYCGTEKECSLSPGLTCQSDADCPPGGGSCQAYGSCAADPSKRCSRDAECDSSEGGDGVCTPRVYFGSDPDACEEQYFEFRHAYSCLSGTTPTRICSAQNHCSMNPKITCTNASQCSPGESCIPGIADFNACFDNTANACRFTPRVYLMDNWGWCTGECRRTTLNGLPADITNDAESLVRHPNGGCYDLTRVKSNIDLPISTQITGINECDPARPEEVAGRERLRPWIVFPGSVQILTGNVQ